MSLRKIAANYIFVPGYPLVKNGYVVLENGRIADVVDTGGVIQEIQGLEFYGGMLVTDMLLTMKIKLPPEGEMIPFLEEIYTRFHSVPQGIALLKGADLPRLAFRPGTCLENV